MNIDDTLKKDLLEYILKLDSNVIAIIDVDMITYKDKNYLVKCLVCSNHRGGSFSFTTGMRSYIFTLVRTCKINVDLFNKWKEIRDLKLHWI